VEGTNTGKDDVAWREEIGISSWVPDLTQNFKPAPFWTLGGDVFSTFQQGNSGGNFTLDGPTLNLQAIQYDEIKVVGESSQEIALDPEDLVDILSILGPRYAPTGEATMTALWRTLIADLYEGQHPAPSFLSSSFLRWSVFVLFPPAGNNCLKESGKLTEIQIKTRQVFANHHSQEYNFSQAIQDVNIEEPPVVCIDVPNPQGFVGSASGAFSNYQTAPVYVSPRWEEVAVGNGYDGTSLELGRRLGLRFTAGLPNAMQL
jgi:hypothetical protein